MEKSNNSIFFLQASDELCLPYENILKLYFREIKWFQDVSSLLNHAHLASPQVVIIDLDALPSTPEKNLDEIRSAFHGSELIAISSQDSSQLALYCIRSGYVDFLLKPISPEELGFAIRKITQRQDLFRKLDDSFLAQALTQLSGCTSSSLIHHYALEYINRMWGCEGVMWIIVKKESDSPIIVSVIPRNFRPKMLEKKVNLLKLRDDNKVKIFKIEPRKVAIFFPFFHAENEGILVWGTKAKRQDHLFTDTQVILEHSQVCLLNLLKFEEIKAQSFLDDLTGLYNSRYLKFALTHSILRCKDPNQHFSVLFIDVDHFKSINDKYGHLVGSEFLIAIARTIKHTVRNFDPVFRYGGDEFVVLLNGFQTAQAKEIAERIRKNIERRVFKFSHCKIQTTVSIGIATYPEHAAERETLLKLADEAMYAAKRTSRNSVHLAIEPSLKLQSNS